MKEVSLVCLNNLLHPVNMRCIQPFKGVYFILTPNCDLYSNYKNADDVMYYELLTPEDLGFKIKESE